MWGGDAFIPKHRSYTKLAILPYFPHVSLPPQHGQCFGSSHCWIICLSILLLKHKSTSCDTSSQTVVASSTASGLLTRLLDASLPKDALSRERDEYWGTWRTGWGGGSGERRTHTEGGRVTTISTCSRLDTHGPAQHDRGSGGSPIIHTATWKSLNSRFTLVKFYLFPLKNWLFKNTAT